MKIWQTTDGKYKDGKYLVLRRDGTVPVWPNFVIGGYDPCAAAALRAYAQAASERGYDAEFVASAYELADTFEKLSASPLARAKADPDAPPHRKDNVFVVQMMQRKYDLVNLLANIMSRLSGIINSPQYEMAKALEEIADEHDN